MYNKCWLFKGIITNSRPLRHDGTKYEASSSTCCSFAQSASVILLQVFIVPTEASLDMKRGLEHTILLLTGKSGDEEEDTGGVKTRMSLSDILLMAFLMN